MISFFTTAKDFAGHTGVIQRNALQSWVKLHSDCEVLLLGDALGSADVARELGLIHVPDIVRNEYDSLLNDLFAVAHASARHALLCYVAADIILLSDFITAACQLRNLHKPFLACGRRSMLHVPSELTFDSGWEEQLRSQDG